MDLGHPGFGGLLVCAAAVALVLGAAWLVLVGIAAVVEAASGGRLAVLRLTGCPAGWRRRLLAVLVPVLAPLIGTVGPPAGAASASGGGPDGPVGTVATAAGSTHLPGALLDGLPLPDLPFAGAPAAEPRAAGLPRTVVVRRGDSLWRLAQDLLPSGADPAAVADLCTRLYVANRAVIGDDPDLIRPGQHLRVPDDRSTADPEEDHR